MLPTSQTSSTVRARSLTIGPHAENALPVRQITRTSVHGLACTPAPRNPSAGEQSPPAEQRRCAYLVALATLFVAVSWVHPASRSATEDGYGRWVTAERIESLSALTHEIGVIHDSRTEQCLPTKQTVLPLTAQNRGS